MSEIQRLLSILYYKEYRKSNNKREDMPVNCPFSKNLPRDVKISNFNFKEEQ